MDLKSKSPNQEIPTTARKALNFNTKCVHAGNEPDPQTGALCVPIVLATTFQQAEPQKNKGYAYSRGGNPTRTEMEKCIAQLENGKFGFAYSSGSSARTAILHLLSAGDCVVSCDDVYGGTYSYFTTILERCHGITCGFYDMTDLENFERYAEEKKPQMAWIESPTNPLLKVVDIRKVVDICKKRNIITVVDNTFSTPYLLKPLDLGADIVMESATKFIGGHSDVLMGLVATNSEAIYSRLKPINNLLGAVPSPFDCYIALRGVKTLHLRLQRQCENAAKVAAALEGHAKIERVLYPGLEGHPGHSIAAEQMASFGSMVSFTLRDGKAAAFRFFKALRIFLLAESLGSVESLANFPFLMTHNSVPAEVKNRLGISESLVRLSVGIEDGEDLVEDLLRALEAV